MWQFLLAGTLAMLIFAGPIAAEVTKASFGKTMDGTAVDEFTITGKNMTVKLINLGAAITEIDVPDKKGQLANVVLGFDDAAGYESDRNQSFGCTTGRVANRIAKGKFTLNGKEYTLAINNGPNHIHGGAKRSLSKVVWKASILNKTATKNGHVEGVRFTYVSPDGEEGYPGTLNLVVTYLVSDQNDLKIEYEAGTTKATPVNLTNHAYFNLAGAGADTALDHKLMIPSDSYVPTDDTLIPTGKIAKTAGTVFDFRTLTRIGDRIGKLKDTGAKGYDLYYILKPSTEPAVAAKLVDPSSGRVLTVLTTEPGVQFYTGNFLHGQKGRGGKEYKQRSAVCLETMAYPDAVNQPTFPSIILQPGQVYRQTCIYRFSTE